MENDKKDELQSQEFSGKEIEKKCLKDKHSWNARFKKIKEWTKNLFLNSKKWFLNVCSRIEKKIYPYKKICIIIIIFLVLTVGIIRWNFLRTAYTFYYWDNSNTEKILTERDYLKGVETESLLQSYVRLYFSGGNDYQMQVPFHGSEVLLGIYHDNKSENLILDWSESFALHWQDGILKQDTELFFYSLKKNFRLNTVRFLVEGKTAGLTWDEFSLDEGVPLKKISLSIKK